MNEVVTSPAPVVETVATETITDPVERLSPKFKALAEKEARASKQLREASTKEAALKQQMEAFEADRKWVQALKHGLQNDPMGTLKQLGFNEGAYTDQQLNSGQLSAEYQIKQLQQQYHNDKQQELQSKRQAEEKAAADRAALEANETALFKKEIDSFVEERKENYPLIDQLGQAYLIYDIIDGHYEETSKTGKPIILSIEEATDKVEKYLEAQVDKLANIEKVRSKFAPPKPVPRSDSHKFNWDETKRKAKTSPTLSNKLTTSAPLLTAPQPKQKTEAERTAAAMARLNAIKQNKGR